MTLSVSLTPELESLVRAKVSSGMYNSASEVVREALRLLERQDRIEKEKLKDLRAAIQEGLDSGPSRSWTAETFLKRMRKKHKKSK